MTKHQAISFVKSGVRILGYAALIGSVVGTSFALHVVIAAGLLIGAEVLGIVEELGQEYGV